MSARFSTLKPPLPAWSPLAATKLEAERLVQAAQLAGLHAVALRPRALFGDGDPTILPRLLAKLRQRRVPRLAPLHRHTRQQQGSRAAASMLG